MEVIKDTLESIRIIALYARVSTQRQEKEKTIRSQIVRLENFAEKHNWKIYNKYIDDGYSGSILERPDLDKLRSDAQLKKFDAILITEQDRLTREFAYQLYLEKEFNKLEILIIYLNRPRVSTTHQDKAFDHMQGVFAEMERGIFLDRTRRGKIQKARDGILITSIAPYGFAYITKSEGGPRYVIDDDEAEVVRLIFMLCIQEGMSIRGIARELAKRGFKARSGNKFGKTTITRILTNPAYIGKVYYYKHKRVESRKQRQNKYQKVLKTSLTLRPKHEWIEVRTLTPSIIDKKIFEKAQKLLKQRRKFFRRPPKHKYLLSGLLFCGKCNSRFLSTPFHGVPYYRCDGRRKPIGAGQRCSATSVNATVLDNTVNRAILNLLTNTEWVMKYLKNVMEYRESEVKKIQEIIAQKRPRIQDKNRKINKLYDLYADDRLEKEMLYTKIGDLKESKKNLIEEINQLQESIVLSNTIPEDMIISEHFIEECFKKLRQNYNKLFFKEKKKILNIIVNRAVYNDYKVFIKGNIPISKHKCSWLLDQSSECYVLRLQQSLRRALHDADL